MTKINKDLLYHEVNKALDTIRPHLAVDGGDIEIVEITNKMTVKVKWLGNCEFCAMSMMTMKAGVEQAIKASVPQIKSIEAVNGIAVKK